MRRVTVLVVLLLGILAAFAASCEEDKPLSFSGLRSEVPTMVIRTTLSPTPTSTPTVLPTSVAQPNQTLIPTPTVELTPEGVQTPETVESPVETEEPEVTQTTELTQTVEPTPEPTQVVEPTSVPTQVGEPTPTPTPAATALVSVTPAPQPSEDFLAFQSSVLVPTVGNYPDWEVGTCVTDLQNGQTICLDCGLDPQTGQWGCTYNGDTQRDTGCVIDLFALFAAVEQFQAGLASPQDYIDWAGTSMAVQIRAGIGSSSPDNAAIFLAAAYGGSLEEGTKAARQIVSNLGLAGTTFGYVPYHPIEENYPANISTAWDTNLALTKLWNGEIFSREWTDYTIRVLTESEYTETMPNLVQWKGAAVAHKIGYFGYESDYPFAVWNDVGIVFWQKGDRTIAFALSVFTKGPWAGEEIVAALADVSYDYFNAKY